MLLVSPILLSVHLVPYRIAYRGAAYFVEERVGGGSVHTRGYSFGLVKSIIGERIFVLDHFCSKLHQVLVDDVADVLQVRIES